MLHVSSIIQSQTFLYRVPYQVKVESFYEFLNLLQNV